MEYSIVWIVLVVPFVEVSVVCIFGDPKILILVVMACA